MIAVSYVDDVWLMFENKNKIYLTVPRKLLRVLSIHILGNYTLLFPTSCKVGVNHPMYLAWKLQSG